MALRFGEGRPAGAGGERGAGTALGPDLSPEEGLREVGSALEILAAGAPGVQAELERLFGVLERCSGSGVMHICQDLAVEKRRLLLEILQRVASDMIKGGGWAGGEDFHRATLVWLNALAGSLLGEAGNLDSGRLADLGRLVRAALKDTEALMGICQPVTLRASGHSASNAGAGVKIAPHGDPAYSVELLCLDVDP